LGVTEVGVQKALLDWAKKRSYDSPKGACKAMEAEVEEQAEAEPEPLTPSAPLPSPDSSPPHTPVTPSAFSSIDVGGSDCVVCMERGSQVIFLPCGHVCCCQVCSGALLNCPLCRGSISQRVRLYQN
ncbi:hypothetical protein CRUP_019356, partial [Coryphaenoides rupestris]